MKNRPEINGLRAIAVASVILFHSGFEIFKGGFLGVDIFFVLSGFLIYLIIDSSLKDHSFTFSNFYLRRARRILPALFVVLIVCIPLALLLMIPDQIKNFSTSLACVSVFISNYFYRTQAGYFAPNAGEDPLIHTWSLSVEEQFYAFIPALTFLLHKYFKNLLPLVFLSIAIASIGYGFYLLEIEPDKTFFDSLARFWELMIGVLAAIVFIKINSNRKLTTFYTEAISTISVFIIFYCIFSSDEYSSFPSGVYLAVTISTACFLVFAHEQTIVGKILSSRIFVHIGLISYSAYLWHQPILAFGRLSLTYQEPSYFKYLVVILTFCTAHFSWKYVEQPFRTQQVNRNFKWLAVSGLVAFFGIGLTGNILKGFGELKGFSLPPKIIASFNSSSLHEHCGPALENAPAETGFCSLGDSTKKPTIAILGDSHSFAILPVFNEIGNENNIGIVHNGLGGCPPILTIYVIEGNHPPDVCYRLVQRQYDYIKENKIKTIFLVARWSLYTDGSYRKGSKIYYLSDQVDFIKDKNLTREIFQKGLQNTIDAYRTIGVTVHLITQAPMQLYDPRNVYNKWYSSDTASVDFGLIKSSVPYVIHYEHQKFIRNIFATEAASKNLSVIDLDSEFCADDYCLIGTSEGSYYSDDDHLSALGSLKIKGKITAVLTNLKQQSSYK